MAQRRCLLAGWWGLRAWAFNLLTISRNLAALRKLDALGAPRGRTRPARPLGPSVVQSPGFAVTILIPIVLAYLWYRAGTG